MNSPADQPPYYYTVAYVTTELLYRLEDVQEQEAQVGREAIMRWKTDDQRWKNAWLTPTGALTDSSSPPLSNSQTPVRSGIITPETDFADSPPLEIHTTSSSSALKRTDPSQIPSHASDKLTLSRKVISESTENFLSEDKPSLKRDEKICSSESLANGSRVGQERTKRPFYDNSRCSEERRFRNTGAKRARVEEDGLAQRRAQPKEVNAPDPSTMIDAASTVSYDPDHKADTTTRVPLVQVVESSRRAAAARCRRSRRLQRLPPGL